MSSIALLRLAQYLTGELGESLCDQIVAQHATTMPIDADYLSVLYRKEMATPTKTRARYEQLASRFMDWIAGDFPRKLARINRAGELRMLLVAQGRSIHSYTLFKPIQTATMVEKLPAVSAKVKAGDLIRFVQLITAVHGFGVCLLCRQWVGFHMLQRSADIIPMYRRLVATGDKIKDCAAELLLGQQYPECWYHIVGYCAHPRCRPSCEVCNAMIPTEYHPAWVKAFREDHLCPACASGMLVNIQRPGLSRREQRKLQRLIIQ